jgi:hypothetical protein
MAACAGGFCCVYFLVNILPHWFKSSKPKKVVVVNDIEKTPIIVNLDDSRSQLRIENIDDSFTGLKKPMLGSGNDKSIANNQTMAGTIHQSFDDSYKISDSNSMFDPANSMTESSAFITKKE